jgi:acyl dehydratase
MIATLPPILSGGPAAGKARPPCEETHERAQPRVLRDRLLEGCRQAQDLGRHHPRRAARDAARDPHEGAHCEVRVGEDNPLYFDEEYAKKTIWGGIIAPPSIHILLMFACTTTEDWMRSPGTINAGQSWFYNVPARPGDTIHMRGTALDRFIRKGRLFVIHDNVFTNQRGEVVCTGRGWTIRPE